MLLGPYIAILECHHAEKDKATFSSFLPYKYVPYKYALDGENETEVLTFIPLI